MVMDLRVADVSHFHLMLGAQSLAISFMEEYLPSSFNLVRTIISFH